MENWKKKLMAKHALTEKDVELLTNIGEMRLFSAGEQVVRMGEVNDHIYILRSGIWREYCFRDGEEATMWFSVAGEITFSGVMLVVSLRFCLLSQWWKVRRCASHAKCCLTCLSRHSALQI